MTSVHRSLNLESLPLINAAINFRGNAGRAICVDSAIFVSPEDCVIAKDSQLTQLYRCLLQR
jgi:hypothetical protein